MELGQIIQDFAAGMEAADKRRPQASSSSTAGRFYQPGIGPFGETKAVALTLAELRTVELRDQLAAIARLSSSFLMWRYWGWVTKELGHQKTRQT